ncbi:hypothetical protein, conserved [Eimeria maxima]|uniref:Transmembrane protein n=1 Tax=Eimeria maxima TaxID=5804 RepID=U6MAI1_EIMMA|nr:hypothetical protein, conserved [Eimeria maxima]CDJ60043.1 hypothetical protein, conserved [Eimeria maxima]
MAGQSPAGGPELPLVTSHTSLEPCERRDGHRNSADVPDIIGSDPQVTTTREVKSASRWMRPKAVSLTFWFVAACVVGMSVLFSHCILSKKINEGAAGRRLAAGNEGHGSPLGRNPLFDEEEWISLDADMLASLCTQIGEWTHPQSSQDTAGSSQSVIGVVSSSEVQGRDNSLRDPGIVPVLQQSAQENTFGMSGDEGPQNAPAPAIPGSSWMVDAPAGTGSASDRSLGQNYPQVVQPGELPPNLFPPDIPFLPSLFNPLPGLTTQHVWGQTLQEMDAVPQSSQASQRQYYPLDVDQGLDNFGVSPQRVDEVSAQLPSSGLSTSSSETDGSSLGHSQVSDAGGENQGTWSERSQQTKLLLRQKLLMKSHARTDTVSNSNDKRGPKSARTATVSKSNENRDPTDAEVQPSEEACTEDGNGQVQLPKLHPDIRPEDMKVRLYYDPDRCGPLIFYLMAIKRLCKRSVLGISAANQMFNAAQKLASRVLMSMTVPVDNTKPSAAVESLGRRFLAFNAFYKVLQVLGDVPQLKESWALMLRKVPTTYSHKPRCGLEGKYGFQYKLAKRLSRALELYKLGGAPTFQEVMEIENQLFCMRSSPKCFLTKTWSVWRGQDNGQDNGSDDEQ